jgi:hypothetical protein
MVDILVTIEDSDLNVKISKCENDSFRNVCLIGGSFSKQGDPYGIKAEGLDTLSVKGLMAYTSICHLPYTKGWNVPILRISET